MNNLKRADEVMDDLREKSSKGHENYKVNSKSKSSKSGSSISKSGSSSSISFSRPYSE